MPHKDSAKNSAYLKEWREANKERKAFISRKSHLKTKYGITTEEYDELVTLWENKCAICSGKHSEKRKSFDIDHCHTHKHIRGILCDRCNKVLGAFKDNIDLFKSAIVYLEAYQESLKELENAVN